MEVLKKKMLGKIPKPEQYYPDDNHFILSDSTDALDFFSENIAEQNGAVCLVKAKLNSLKYPFMIFWAYVSVEQERILSLTPVFKVEPVNALERADILELELIDTEAYFYWDGNLHAAVWTEDNEIVVRQVRSILSANDMRNVIQLTTDCYCDEAIPVKMFQRSTGKYLGIFWMCSIDETTNGFEVACQDDLPDNWDNDMLQDSFYHLIDIGERVIMDHAYYKLQYNPVLGQHLVRLPFLLTDADYRREDIPEELFKKNLCVATETKKPQKQNPKADSKKMNHQKTKIISFFPNKK